MSRACPACGTSDAIAAGDKNGFAMVRCRRCRTLYTSHLPDEDAACDYSVYYTDANLSVPELVHRRLDEIVAEFASYRANNRLLDVGCGAGSLLHAAVRAGWDAEGLEVSSRAVAHLQRAGLKVRCEYLESAGYPDDYFDVVAAGDVLEHVPNVASLVSEAVRVLRPGGLFYATTPNGTGGSALLLGVRWSVVSPPEHLHLFTVKGMKLFLTARGLRPRRIVCEGTNPIEMLHVLRTRNGGRTGAVSGGGGFDRVSSAYALNEAFTRSASRRFVKRLANGALRRTGLGDELKIYADKSPPTAA